MSRHNGYGSTVGVLRTSSSLSHGQLADSEVVCVHGLKAGIVSGQVRRKGKLFLKNLKGWHAVIK